MLITQAKNLKWIKEEVSKRTDFNSRWKKIFDKVSSNSFRNNLQGVLGFVDENLFEKHKKALIEIEKV